MEFLYILVYRWIVRLTVFKPAFCVTLSAEKTEIVICQKYIWLGVWWEDQTILIFCVKYEAKQYL